MEGTAAFFEKILTPEDPNFVDIRSPIGSGTGQLAFNYDRKGILRMKVAWLQLWEMIIFTDKVGENSIRNSHIIQRYKHLLIQVFWMVCHNVIVVERSLLCSTTS